MKKILSKVSIYLMTFVMLFANSPAVLIVNALGGETGSNPVSSVTMGDLDAAGHVQVTKSVTDNGNGEYSVTFNVQSVATKLAKPLYAVVVFDRSGSMICDPDEATADTPGILTTNYHYQAADGTKIRCEGFLGFQKEEALTREKWENAISGAQNFNSSLKNELGDNAHISLITFSSDVSDPTSDFSSPSFEHPIGGTDLAGAIEAAITKLNSDVAVNNDPDAKKVILVISDGRPDWEDDATDAANTAKNDNNIDIYAIGYETDEYTSAFLQSIATDADHYSDANETSVSLAVQSMAEELADLSGASIIETPNSPKFSLKNGENGNKLLEVDSVNNNTGIVTYKPISYTVTIDPTTPSGVYEINDKNNTKIVAGDDVLFDIDESPSVRWTRPSYGYTVNYYKDSKSESNFLGSTSSEAELSTTVTLSNDELLSKLNAIDNYEGYKLANDQANTITISANPTNNTLDVIYVKGQFSYKVNYFYENLNGGYDLVADNTEYLATFDTAISESEINQRVSKGLEGHSHFYFNKAEQTPTKIETSGNYLNIYYTRNEYDYCINYFYDDETTPFETSEGKAKYEDTVTYTGATTLKPGYVLDHTDPTTGEIVIGGNTNNIIKVFYIKGRYQFTVNYFIDNGDSTTKVGDTYTGSKQEFGTIYELTDSELNKELPTGYELKAGQGRTISITENEANNNLDVYYVKANFGYTINYYKDSKSDSNKLGDTVSGTALFGSTKTLSESELKKELRAGYKLADGQVNSIDITENVSDNNLDVIYVKANFNYCINYFYDGEQDTNETIEGEETYESFVSYVDKIRKGYILSYLDPENGTIQISDDVDSNIINVYYNRVRIPYSIEYYYDNVIDESKTDVGFAFYQTTIDEHGDKLVDGFEFDRVEGIPLIIDEDKNVIRVYYKSKPIIVDEPIPNTSVDGVSEFYKLFLFILSLVSTSLYVERKKNNN